MSGWYVWVAVAVVVLLLALGLWLYSTANRLDEMHHRIELARGALQTQLLRRSGTALELAGAELLDPPRSLVLLEAAHAARAARPEELETAESELSEVLRAVFADGEEVRALRQDPVVGDLLEELGDQCVKVELARRFHNDAVVSARGLRATRRVRWLRLTGGAGPLSTVDLDDRPPPALVAD